CGSHAVLSHFAAAALWGFVRWDDRYPEVTVIGVAHRRQQRIRIHRTQQLDARDGTRHEMIPVTSPARTLVDLASLLGYRPLRRAVRQAQSMRLTSVVQLADALCRAGRKRGVSELRRIIATGPAPTRSELEDVILDLIVRGGLVHPEVNVPLL